jgi:hypothetical protein
MGFINKLFGGLFAVLGSIFGGLFKLIGLGKKSEYFLEADAASGTSTEAKAPAPAKVEAKPAPAKAAAKSAPATPAAASTNGKVANPAPAVAAAKPVAPAEPQATNFATNFSVNGTSSRRRPGPSLNPFLDMAKQIKPQS